MQTFTDFEVLIIDGVSKDNTLFIASKFNDPRIKIMSEPDEGIYDAMNKGIKQAKGEWLYFFGSDDTIYDISVLDTVFREICKGKIDIIYGNVVVNEGVYDGVFDFTKIQYNNICHQAIFYSHRVLYELGGYNVKYHVFSDYDFNLRWFFCKKYKYIYIDKIIANFSSTGYSSKYNDDFYEDLYSKLVRLGIRKLSIEDLKKNALNAAIVKFQRHQYLAYFYFKSLYYIFRIVSMICRRISFLCK